MKRQTLTQLGLVVALLLIQFFLRTHHTRLQDPYVDEALHIKRAAVVWDFDTNPGRFAHGKLLVYFWLGLFRPEPYVAIPVSRAGMAIFSLISGAAIYAIGRRLSGHAAGALALGIYAVLPLALFYERMAMADPLASGLAALVTWRSLAYARRPRWREGIVLGVLLGLATLAKLTMGLLPLVPALVALLYYPWSRADLRPQMIRWLRAYVPPLLVAGVIVALMWAPLVIPAYFARNSDHPFKLVNPYNIRSNAEEPDSPDTYVGGLMPLAYQVTSRGLIAAAVVALVYLIVISWKKRNLFNGLVVLIWFVGTIVLSFVAARLITLRYFMPAAGPIAMILALGMVEAWQVPRGRWLARGVIVAGLAAWLAVFALPFIHTDLTEPHELPFKGTNWTEYISGFLSADDGVRAGAATVEALPRDHTITATWYLCHMIFLYSDQDVECLTLDTPLDDLKKVVSDLPAGDTLYFAITGYKDPPFFQRIPGICWEPVAHHERPLIKRPVDVWQLWKEPCPPDALRAG